jgi:hypothetical protein
MTDRSPRTPPAPELTICVTCSQPFTRSAHYVIRPHDPEDARKQAECQWCIAKSVKEIIEEGKKNAE